MENNIWEKGRVNHLVAADAPRGGTTSADYSGLHRYADAAESGELLAARGAAAQQQADIRAREALNEGVDFSGFLTRRKCAHVDLLIGKHATLGVVALVDVPTSHSENKVEVLFHHVSTKKILSRNDFFNQLENEPLTDDVVEQVCQDYRRHFVLLQP
jgi:hypothetical protein